MPVGDVWRNSWLDTWNGHWKQAGAAVPSATIGISIFGADESTIRAGGLSGFITLHNDIWVAVGGTFDAQIPAIIAGITSAQSEATGWNALVRDGVGIITVVRESDDLVSFHLAAVPGYDITAIETITVTVPAAALNTSVVDLVGTPTFDIFLDTPPPPPEPEGTGGGKGDNRNKYSARPLGLAPSRRKKVEVVPAVERETTEPVLREQPGTVPEREGKIGLAPVSQMLPAEIDAEIAYWLKLKLRNEDDLRLILIISGSVH